MLSKNQSYSTGKQRSKGKEMTYTDIEMAEYLQPSSPLTISQKQTMFAVRNRMIEIYENFPGKNIEDICHCRKKETMEHIYNCDDLNKEICRISSMKIFVMEV